MVGRILVRRPRMTLLLPVRANTSDTRLTPAGPQSSLGGRRRHRIENAALHAEESRGNTPITPAPSARKAAGTRLTCGLSIPGVDSHRRILGETIPGRQVQQEKAPLC